MGGGWATSRDLNLDRYWRNIRTVYNHNPLLHKARVVGDFYLNGTKTHLLEAGYFNRREEQEDRHGAVSHSSTNPAITGPFPAAHP